MPRTKKGELSPLAKAAMEWEQAKGYGFRPRPRPRPRPTHIESPSARQYVKWDEFMLYSDILAGKLKGIKLIRRMRIVPICRGGLIPGTILSHKLDLPITDVVDPSWVRSLTPDGSGDILVVDDICDTGQTFNKVRHAYPRATFVSVFVKPEGLKSGGVDFSALDVPQTTWIVQPWESENSAEVRDQDRQ